MKTKMSFALSAIILLTALTSCGGSGSNNNNNLANNGNFDAYYNQCLYDTSCYNTLFENQFGYNNNFFAGYQTYNGYPCQTWSIPYYNNAGAFLGNQQFGIAPPGAYMPQYGINGTGGAFSIGFGGSVGWN